MKKKLQNRKKSPRKTTKNIKQDKTKIRLLSIKKSPKNNKNFKRYLRKVIKKLKLILVKKVLQTILNIKILQEEIDI